MHKRWKMIVPPDYAFHISVGLDEARMPIGLHDHDFAEVSWVAEGRGIHRINGRRVEIRAGDLVMIRPADRHGFAAIPGESFRLENVAFPRKVLARMRLAYFPNASTWFWTDGPMPFTLFLDAVRLAALQEELEWLRRAPRDSFSLDYFLLSLFRRIGGMGRSDRRLPDWLDGAIGHFGTPDDLREGVHRFYRLAGRSPGHVARAMRALCGQTPSSWVNDQRIDYAARLLETTLLPVTEVAAECGIENLSYFHRLFRRRHGTPPYQYRKRLRPVM